MAITLTQTDTASTDTVTGCSGGAVNSQVSNKLATAGGTAGTTPVNLTHDATASQVEEIGFESAANEPNNTTWASGSWTVRLEVTTSNMNLTWQQWIVCEMTGGGSCTQINGATPAIALSSTGIKSSTATPAGFPYTAAASSRIGVTNTVVSASTMSTQAWAYKPSQNIDTPIVQVALVTNKMLLLFGQTQF